MKNTKPLIITALCVALGIVVPMVFHSIPNGGVIFCPMHIPILMCAIICGWNWGFVCGIITPILSSLLTGMPPSASLPYLVVEFAVYGVVAGLMMKWVKTKNIYANLYISLIVAMLAGRVINGVGKAIFLTGGYSLSIWLTSSFVTCLPGILIQLIFIPMLYMILVKSKLINVKNK